MADKKISQLTDLPAASVSPSNDVLAIVDTNVTETKKITAKALVDGALNAGTANGLVYLNGSKETTSGSVITYDGTTFGVDDAVVINESGGDNDTRIEGDTDANLFFVDASTDNIGIGESAPDSKFEIVKNVTFSNIDTYPQLCIKPSTGSTGNRLNIAVDNSSNLAFIQAVNRGVAEIPLVLQRYNGNLLVGTSTDGTGKLQVNGEIRTYNSTNSAYFGIDAAPNAYIGTAATNASLKFETGGTERARITTGGDFLIGTTSFTNASNKGLAVRFSSATNSGGEGGVEIRNTSSSTDSDFNPPLIIYKGSVTTSSNQRFIQFYADDGGQPMGGIVGNGATNVQFVSLSDARQKTNIQSISGSLEKILALNPVSFDWIKNGEHVNAGFVAQNVEQVFPEFVVENFDTENGEPRKGLTGGMTGGIVAHLVKAIQEQQAMIEELKAKVAALEVK